MAESAHLIVALSGRALATAARRSGHRPLVLDLFGDADTRAAAHASETIPGDLAGFDPDALIAAADRLAPEDADRPAGIVYGAGLEARPDLLGRLTRRRPLLGNRPEVIARTKDPGEFFGRLAELGLPHPPTQTAPPADPRDWLRKAIGAAGGAHVVPAGGPARAGTYFQRRLAGRTVAVAFLADGRRAQVVGITEQWSAPTRESPHRFGGAVYPAAIDDRLARRLAAAADAIAAEFGLVGLNSLDAIVSGGRFWIVEVNPRPGASLDVLDGADPIGLFGRHLAACAGGLRGGWRAPSGGRAMAVAYAIGASGAPRAARWPEWIADRPTPGAVIPAGAPFCTVLVSAPSAAAARVSAARRVAGALSTLSPLDPPIAAAS